MIAYYAQPNRFHPRLLRILKQHYKSNSSIFSHITINNIQYALHLTNHQIEEITIEKILKAKSADFFSGVLHPKYNSLLQPDFSFTIISEPVNRIYQLFHIIKFLEKEYMKEGIIQKIFNTECLTIEYFIDNLLENEYHKNVISEHIFLLPEEIETTLDFVGIAEESERTKNLLEKYLNIELNEFDFTERKDRCIYRIQDVRDSLEKELDLYYRLRSKLL